MGWGRVAADVRAPPGSVTEKGREGRWGRMARVGRGRSRPGWASERDGLEKKHFGLKGIWRF